MASSTSSCKKPRTISAFNRAFFDTLERIAHSNSAAYEAHGAPRKQPPPAQERQHLTATYDSRPSHHEESLTMFHTQQHIPFGVASMVDVLFAAVGTDDAIVFIAAVLACRYCAIKRVPPTTRLLHRLVVTCLHVAAKANSDFFLSNAEFAKLAGLALPEQNRLERHLLHGLRWCASVSMVGDHQAHQSQRDQRDATMAAFRARMESELDAVPRVPFPMLGVSHDHLGVSSEWLVASTDSSAPSSTMTSGASSTTTVAFSAVGDALPSDVMATSPYGTPTAGSPLPASAYADSH
jgi:hypothetical protein